jgi:hypothetical protein
MAQGFRVKVKGLHSGVLVFGFLGFGFWVLGFGFWVLGLGFRVEALGLRV